MTATPPASGSPAAAPAAAPVAAAAPAPAPAAAAPAHAPAGSSAQSPRTEDEPQRNGYDGRPPRTASPDFDLPKIEELRGCYDPGYCFPSWIRARHPGKPLESYAWRASRIYYNSGSTVADVMEVVTKREPVNIQMRGHYRVDKLRRLGWDRSGYTSLYERTKRLPPQVAVYCYTPICRTASAGEIPDESESSTPDRSFHILNVIAPGFDSVQQPDYDYFFGESECITDERLEAMQVFFERVFGFILRCAAEHSLKTVLIPLFGCNNFGRMYRSRRGSGGLQLFADAFLPALRRTLLHYGRGGMFGKRGLSEVSVFGTPMDTPQLSALTGLIDSVSQTLGNPLRPSRICGLFPEDSVMNEEHTLIVSAWDPHSIAGNGNKRDNSLDGFVGRHSAVGVLCWPLANLWLQTDAGRVAVEDIPSDARSASSGTS
eukprot:TRINITY_DN8417_c6_g1_i1.p1 TRINITY_DN8417_c6_g1~~TRINITY_DN8417_c6_g1_i1.p1  ORF type:complete len:447 (+),score=154.42 TRINITY_DN8417_c6_g1_i1:50-1342(+)